MSLLLTVNKLNKLFLCFHCWLYIGKWLLGSVPCFWYSAAMNTIHRQPSQCETQPRPHPPYLRGGGFRFLKIHRRTGGRGLNFFWTNGVITHIKQSRQTIFTTPSLSKKFSPHVHSCHTFWLALINYVFVSIIVDWQLTEQAFWWLDND